MLKISTITSYPHNSSLTLSETTLSADLNTVVIFSWSDRLNLLSRLDMSDKEASFVTHSVLLKCAASDDFLKKSLEQPL